MARTGLLNVSRNEPRQAVSGGALRVDLEPQLRGPSGLQGPNPSGITRNGGRSGNRRTLRRYSRVAFDVSFRSRVFAKQKAPDGAPFSLRGRRIKIQNTDLGDDIRSRSRHSMVPAHNSVAHNTDDNKGDSRNGGSNDAR